jgi:hypothetical protein
MCQYWLHEMPVLFRNTPVNGISTSRLRYTIVNPSAGRNPGNVRADITAPYDPGS